MRKTYEGIVGAVLLASVAGGLVWADSSMLSSSTTSVTTESQAKSPQDMKWTELKGKVNHVDLQNKVVQIKESGSDTLLEIPVSDKVTIYKNDRHAYALGDLKEGDKVTLRNNQS